MELIRRKIDTQTEKKIVTALIVSKVYLQEVVDILDLNYFQIPFVEKIAKWCIDFYLSYEDAPYKHIQDIFDRESERMDEDEAELIRKFLKDLSKRYAVDDEINVPYLLRDITIPFCRKRELEITNKNINYLLKNNDVQGAEDELRKFRKVQLNTSGWVNPFDEDIVYKYTGFDEDYLVKFPGDLGEFLGPYKRGWLVGITGPFKRGKTFFLREFAKLGVTSRKRVADFSLEMTTGQSVQRIYKTFTGYGDNEGIHIYPAFDCHKNQQGTCKYPERTNRFTLVDSNTGNIPAFSIDNPYRPCSYCRKSRPDRYEYALWYEGIERKELSANNVLNKAKILRKFGYDKYIRTKSYPRFTANLEDIKRDLDILETSEGFIPDIVLIDYADILRPEYEHLSGTEKEDRTWIALAQLASERGCLVVTPTQGTRDSIDANQLEAGKHTSKWVGKLGHVDAMLSLNQTRQEKEMGVMRIGEMMHRHKDFNDADSVTILQQLATGQANLDSYYQR
jgi:hypothetical protein